MATQIRPDAALKLPLFTYFTLPPEMRVLVPKWLWEKKMVNSNTRGKKPAANNSKKLFEEDVVDLYLLADDLTRKGFVPCYIHHQVRDNGSIRIRVDWEKGKDPLPKEQVLWVLRLLQRFVWDAQSYTNPDGTEHLPPHTNISCGKPTERDQATCVYSVQIVNKELALINDPGDAQDSSNRSHRKAKAGAK